MQKLTKSSHWKIRAYLDANLQFNSHLLRGLNDMQAQGEVKLTFGLGIQSATAMLGRGYSVMILDVEASNGKKFRLAYDPRDQNNEVCLNSLSVSDLYYKVNFNRTCVTAFGNEAIRKILPAGLFFPVRPFSTEKLFRRSMVYALFAVFAPGHFRSIDGPFNRKSLRGGITRTKQIPRKHWNNYRERKDPAGYEALREMQSQPGLFFFNPRAWDGDPLHRELSANKLAPILEILRDTLGNDFQGGFRPLAYARKHFPGLLFEENSHSSYIEAVGKSDVVVSTRGMWDCFAFKLPEYFAAGRCVLAEEFVNELPDPMIDGEHIIFYKSDLTDLAEKCQLLQRDSVLRTRIAHNAMQYYDRHIKPINAVRRILIDATNRLA